MLATWVAGCANTMQPISETESSTVRVSVVVGDTVRVLTKNGDRQTFKVTEITEETLDGKEQSIRYDAMAFVEKRVSDRKKEDKIAASVIFTMIGGILIGDALFGVGTSASYGAP